MPFTVGRTVVVSDPTLQSLPATDTGFLGIGDHVDECDSIEADYLLEVNIATVITIDVLGRKTKIGAI